VSRCARATAVVATALVLPGCGADRVPPEMVAAEAADALAQRTGVRGIVDCPEELQAKPGKELRCVLTPEGSDEQYGVTVRVTSVEGDMIDVDVEVDDASLAEDAPAG
jgi:hypothetical protein